MYLKNINFKNKNILVTGAGKGLGRATAIAMAESGAHVYAISRTNTDLDKLEKIIKKTKGKVTKINCDVTNYEHLIHCLEKIKKLMSWLIMLELIFLNYLKMLNKKV